MLLRTHLRLASVSNLIHITAYAKFSSTAQLRDNTLLAASFTDGQLEISATGNIYSISEVGEQLAWIGAALRSSPYQEEASYCMAYVADISIKKASLVLPRSEGRCDIKFRMECLRDDNVEENGWCWRGMFRNPTIVRGYPIPCRPGADNTGLEIPLEIVARLTNCQKLVKFAGTTFIKGFAAMLAAARVIDNIIVWHLCYNPDGQYISYEDSQVLQNTQHRYSVTMDTIVRSRHVVGWTDHVKNYAGSYIS
jgi:hypothetical protein